MPELVAALSDGSPGGQESVHGPLRAEVGLLVEQGRDDLGWSAIDKTVGVEGREHGLLLVFAESPGGGGVGRRWWGPEIGLNRR
jgi:hypothetical protein